MQYILAKTNIKLSTLLVIVKKKGVNMTLPKFHWFSIIRFVILLDIWIHLTCVRLTPLFKEREKKILCNTKSVYKNLGIIKYKIKNKFVQLLNEYNYL